MSKNNLEARGLEPRTPGLQSRCSSQLSYAPRLNNECTAEPCIDWNREEKKEPRRSRTAGAVGSEERSPVVSQTQRVEERHIVSDNTHTCAGYTQNPATCIQNESDCLTSIRRADIINRFTFTLKGGDPAALSSTATLLRLHPPYQAYLRHRPPLQVRRATSGTPNSGGVTGGVYKARERIHRAMLMRDY
jgi:hypothetical protein